MKMQQLNVFTLRQVVLNLDAGEMRKWHREEVISSLQASYL